MNNSIFKIKADSRFFANGQNQISFCKNQTFFVLGVDFLSNFYFVSTIYHLPFSKTAITGFVPIELFEIIEESITLHQKWANHETCKWVCPYKIPEKRKYPLEGVLSQEMLKLSIKNGSKSDSELDPYFLLEKDHSLSD